MKRPGLGVAPLYAFTSFTFFMGLLATAIVLALVVAEVILLDYGMPTIVSAVFTMNAVALVVFVLTVANLILRGGKLRIKHN